MRAVRIKAFGQPTEVFHLVDLPEPPGPAAGEVLVQLDSIRTTSRSAGTLPPAHLRSRLGFPTAHRPYRLPASRDRA